MEGGQTLRLRCVSVGPRSEGRDYGLLPRFRSLRVPDAAGAVLSDFALALLQWGQGGDGDFALYFPLDAAEPLYLLARVAHLGSESLGPVVIANGLLLDRSALEAVDWRPHRLLGQIQSPRDGAWDSLEIESALPSAPPPSATLAELGGALPRFGAPTLVVVDDPDTAERALKDILEGAPNLAGLYPSWALTGDLPRVERFNPGRFGLVVVPGDPKRSPPPAYHISGGQLFGPPLPDSVAWRLWNRLFLQALAGRRALLEEAAEYAPRVGQQDGNTTAIAAMQAVLRHPQAEGALWPLLESWADGAASLGEEDGILADQAVAAVVRELIEGQSEEAAKAALLKAYLRDLAPRLTRAPAMLAAGLAAGHGLIPLLDEDELALLLGRGLSRALAQALRDQELAGGDVVPERLSLIAGAVVPRVAGASVSVEMLELAQAVVGEVAKGLKRRPEAFEALSGLALGLAEQTLNRSAEWRGFATKVAELWKVSPPSRERRQLFERLRAAPSRFWRRPRDVAARRLAAVAVDLASGRSEAA